MVERTVFRKRKTINLKNFWGVRQEKTSSLGPPGTLEMFQTINVRNVVLLELTGKTPNIKETLDFHPTVGPGKFKLQVFKVFSALKYILHIAVSTLGSLSLFWGISWLLCWRTSFSLCSLFFAADARVRQGERS